jgi:4'-phosphopantetheinyl transferase
MPSRLSNQPFWRGPSRSVCSAGASLPDRDMQDNALDPGTVRVRWVSLALSGAADLERWQAVLDSQERAQAQRFRFAVDRQAYAAAHALARSMVAEVAGTTPAALRFAAGPDGKPRLAAAVAQCRVQFNLSRSRSHVACGVTLTDELGIDVESAGHADALALAERYFAPTEVEMLRQAAPDRRGPLFASLWTLKEAFVKATGEGLRRSLADLSFTLDPIAVRFHGASQTAGGDWQFAQLCPGHGQVIAIAVRRPAEQPIVLDAKEIHPCRF